jgi:hypothetical protein
MAGKLEVSFNSPQCGWMSVGFRDGENEFHTTTAHAPHAGALPELMRLLTDLAGSGCAESDHTLQWNRDPEEFDFHFRKAADRVILEIYEYPTEARDTSERRLVFSHTSTIPELLGAFGETFDQLFADRETDEFEFNWRQPFPFAEYERFKAIETAK